MKEVKMSDSLDAIPMFQKDFFENLNNDLDQQHNWIMQELSNKLDGQFYQRDRDLEFLLPNIKIKECPLINVTHSDITCTLFVIGELKGKLQASVSHKHMLHFFPKLGNYDKDLHINLTGALKAETRNLYTQLREIGAVQEVAVKHSNLPKRGNDNIKAVENSNLPTS
jgi:hypothetical protein